MNVFISYEYGNIQYRNQVKSILNNPNTNIPHNPIHETKNVKSGGQKKVNKYISSLMRDTDVILCLIGENTYNAPGVRNEINTANNWGIPVIPIRINGTRGDLPKEIRVKRTIPLRPFNISDALNHASQWK